MFTSQGYYWRFIRLYDKRTGSKTTTVCMIKPVGMKIGWARAGIAQFSPNREVVKVFDEQRTDEAQRSAVSTGRLDDLDEIEVWITYTDSFNKSVGRVVALHNALVNIGYDSFFCNSVMEDAIDQPEFFRKYPEGPQWEWLNSYLHRTIW